MKRTKKNIRTLLITVLMGFGAMCVVSCSDDMHEENYYTFTGEMMSDYLQSHEDFSEFAAIVTNQHHGLTLRSWTVHLLCSNQ